MPISRLISDLDHLTTELSVNGPAKSLTLEELRLTVARVNELRRQLDIAQLKLSSVLSLAGMKVLERQVESVEASNQFSNRFNIPADLHTDIAEIDEAHRNLFQMGNHLYWLALQRDVKAKDVEVALQHLTQCAKNAFAFEEKMMDLSGYPRFEHHRSIHQRMLDYLSEMQELVSIEPIAVVVKLERFFGSWFLWHLQRDDVDFSKYFLRERGSLPVATAQSTVAAAPAEIETAAYERPDRSPVRELEYLIRSHISSLLISWRERRHVARTSRAMLAQYRSIAKSNPELSHSEIYRFVVMAHTGCDLSTASKILDRAEESFAEWPVNRDLKLRDVVHYLTVTEYLDRYGKDFWLRSEINKMVSTHIPGNL